MARSRKTTCEKFYKLGVDLAARRDLRSPAKIVLAIIKDYIGNKGDCWLGIRGLGRRSGLNEKTVLAAVCSLEAAGDLTIQRGGIGRPNHYRLAGESAPRKGALQGTERSKERSAPKKGASAPRNGAQALQGGVQIQTDLTDRLKKARKRKADADPRVAQFIDWFAQQYEIARGRPYIVSGAKEGDLLKKLLQKLDAKFPEALAELKEAAQAMLADPWGGPNASIGLVCSQINKWLAAGETIPTDAFAEGDSQE